MNECPECRYVGEFFWTGWCTPCELCGDHGVEICPGCYRYIDTVLDEWLEELDG